MGHGENTLYTLCPATPGQQTRISSESLVNIKKVLSGFYNYLR